MIFFYDNPLRYNELANILVFMKKKTNITRQLCKTLYRKLLTLANGKKPPGTMFTDAEILIVYLWSVLNDRPVSWAADKTNWPYYWQKKIKIPDGSTISRRMKTASTQRLLADLESEINHCQHPSICRFIDAKPLAIGGCSKDPDAGYGHAAGCKAKGYKFYAIGDLRQGFVSWDIRPMQHNEATVAMDLIKKVDIEGYIVGDTAYDANKLFDAAMANNLSLITIKRKGGLGHRPQSSGRLNSIEILKRNFGQGLIDARRCIEQMFAQLTNLSFGLKPLPNWVRTLKRVKNWVRAKLIFNQIWRILKKE